MIAQREPVSAALILLVIWTQSADAAAPRLRGNDSCWSVDIPDGPARPDITCSNLSEETLDALRGSTRTEVTAAMGVPGRVFSDGRLHFLGNDTDRGAYTGDVDFTFDASGRVAVIEASVERHTAEDKIGPEVQFIWNADGQACSDHPRSQMRCER